MKATNEFALIDVYVHKVAYTTGAVNFESTSEAL